MAADAPSAPAYDNENDYAKILDKKTSVHKVYETRTMLAFLEPHPIAEGHVVVLPKMKGHQDFLSMPSIKAAEFLSEVHKIARAVKQAFEADGVNMWQDSGSIAGQAVMHPHFHILPRKTGDSALKFPPSAKEALSAEAAKPLQAKIEEALHPKKPLRKANYGKVSSIRPDSTGLNLKLKVLGDVKEVDSKVGKFYEVHCGDASGSVVVSLRENQKDPVKKDATIILRNASVIMVTGHVRLGVDKWGKVEAADEPLEETVEMDEKKNVSATEYELVVSK